jgi:hypothetical protein
MVLKWSSEWSYEIFSTANFEETLGKIVVNRDDFIKTILGPQ